jgi:hypothetical protein
VIALTEPFTMADGSTVMLTREMGSIWGVSAYAEEKAKRRTRIHLSIEPPSKRVTLNM